jgi:hypothetical protein
MGPLEHKVLGLWVYIWHRWWLQNLKKTFLTENIWIIWILWVQLALTSKWTMAGLTGIGCMGTWLGSVDGWNGDNSVYILPAGKSLSRASPPVNCIRLLHLQSSSTCSSGLGFRYTLKPIETQLSLLGWHWHLIILCCWEFVGICKKGRQEACHYCQSLWRSLMALSASLCPLRCERINPQRFLMIFLWS